MDKISVEQLEAGPSSIEGRGVFATAPIRAGERVIEYIGEKISKEESQRRCGEGNNYIFCLNEDLDLDGSVDGNLARLINHSCAPNTEAQVEEDRIWVIALRDIATGEEITYNYGYDLQDFQEHPCRCGARACVGYILAEEHWSDIARCDRALTDRGPELSEEEPAAQG